MKKKNVYVLIKEGMVWDTKKDSEDVDIVIYDVDGDNGTEVQELWDEDTKHFRSLSFDNYDEKKVSE
jgi:hypothetical protein